ncbi:MAG: hypothetical protein ACOZNI_12385 [Myxococcota bacterium]
MTAEITDADSCGSYFPLAWATVRATRAPPMSRSLLALFVVTAACYPGIPRLGPDASDSTEEHGGTGIEEDRHAADADTDPGHNSGAGSGTPDTMAIHDTGS